MSDYLLVTNADAGTADEAALERATGALGARGDVHRIATSSPDELDEVLRDAAGRRIVVAGGDGSLHAVVAALHRRGELAERELALVPLGTGNDFARGTGIPLDPVAAAELAATGTPGPVDLLVDDEGGVVVNNVHLGAGAEASRIGARLKESLGRVGVGDLNLGMLGYPLGVIAAGFRVSPARLRVEVDGRVIADGRERLLMVSVGNGTSVGGGAELTPLARVDDGAADVMISRATTSGSVLRYLVELVRGRVHSDPAVQYLRGTRIQVSARGSTTFWCSADGELSGPVPGRSWELLPGALSMVLPDRRGGGSIAG